ncbi:hypothetical protein [Bdellovibrio sp. KM01]|uniref:hypothetical protein n=1 Tax=Bdellovibrio sp. KM01 TaxID=2748865 RepID=UPI0015E9C344|nr:hypothetical protein [Bdellovibrio sp. KM01]QLY24181.1 hypothetical protein HW988_11980 [Bdellovibrio sp. KM01]
MKKVLFTLIAVLPAVSFAKKIDSSLAAQGKITIKSTTEVNAITPEEAVKIAYEIFAKKNPLVINEVKRVQEVVKETDPKLCGKLDAVKYLALTNWGGGRPSVDGEIGGETNYMVIQPVSCDGVGTGLYAGVADNAIIAITVENTIKDVFSDDLKQVLTVTIQGKGQISVQ